MTVRRLAIITARGGSKRIPRKNIKYFCGKPIISYSIEAAMRAGCFSEVMVSTDDEDIAEISKNYGAKVPFLRSAKNSDDFSGTADVLFEVLTEYEKNGENFEQCCCLYPAAPFITSELLLTSLMKMEGTGSKSLVPVAEFSSPIFRAMKIEDNSLQRIWSEHEKTRSQDLPKTYFDVGQFYWFDVKSFMKSKKLLTEKTTPLIVSWKDFQDIDTPDDWEEAEFKFNFINRQG
jgi:N-acylneuraminate cytidylyltransferase